MSMGREKRQAGKPRERESTEATYRGGGVRSSDETIVMIEEQRDSPKAAGERSQPRKREEHARPAKSYQISKWEVWEAYQAVKANAGAGGVDGQSIEEFEQEEKKHLYKLWNRMSSGSYHPEAVRRVEIPKTGGGTRPLGIPTVTDRIAQTVVKRRIEPIFERRFHSNSYGYRPGKSAQDAVGMARMRCWERPWVVDLDIKGFFDAIDHALLLRALRPLVPEGWQLLYIERWLTAGVQMEDGQVKARERGTPQGGVISPLLANIFLHYALDRWLVRELRNSIRFERYADDMICHCRTRRQAEWLLDRLRKRLCDCGLELHPQKTKIVYCGQDKRTQRQEAHCSFDFLGFTFRQRSVCRDGKYTNGFVPAISNKASQMIRATMRVWSFRRHVNWSMNQVKEYWNPILRGSITTGDNTDPNFKMC